MTVAGWPENLVPHVCFCALACSGVRGMHFVRGLSIWRLVHSRQKQGEDGLNGSCLGILLAIDDFDQEL